jgi:hypothetical protein
MFPLASSGHARPPFVVRRGPALPIAPKLKAGPCFRSFMPDDAQSAELWWIRQSRRASLSIVEIVVVTPRHYGGRTLQKLGRVIARFARSWALGRIAADLGL